MNLKQLEYFVDLAQTRNYTQTAKRMFVSQTAITKQIQNLERELNALLFERNKRYVALTPVGEMFLTEAKGILERVQASYLHLEAYQRGERGCLRIGFLKNFDFDLLQKVIMAFHQAYPNVQLELGGYARRELEDKLWAGELDLIVSIDTPETPDFHKLMVKSFPLVAILPSNHPQSGQPWIGGDELSHLIYDIRKENDSTPNPEMEGAMLQVSAQLGEAIVHEFVVQANVRRFVSVVPLKPRQEREIYVMCHQNRYNPLIPHFEEVMKEQWR